MGPSKPVILLTNDDSIFSEGIKALENSLSRIGDLYVVAPDRERNANSHCISLKTSIYVKQDDERHFSVSGTPSDCVNIGVHRLLPRKPDLVISGINEGGNLSDDVTYSGTVAAALEARLLHIPSMAFSLAMRDNFIFEPAARIAAGLVLWFIGQELPYGVFYNVNIPHLPDGVAGKIRWTRLGQKIYSDFLEEGRDDQGRLYYRFGVDDMRFLDDETADEADWKVVRQGCVSITPLNLNMTDETYFANLKGSFNPTQVEEIVAKMTDSSV